MQSIPFHDVPAYVARAPSLPVGPERDRAEVRLYATIVAGATFWALLRMAYYLGLTRSTTVVQRVAGDHAAVLAVLFGVAACALIPHICCLVFLPDQLVKRWPRKIAAAGMVGAGVLWAVMATLARELHLGIIPLTYWVSGLGYMLIGGAFGYSLNSQQAQELINEKQPAAG